MNKGIFQLENIHIGALGPELAVEMFRQLLWAEATALGIATNLINVPSAITVKDGGIDAEVKDIAVAGGQGIIKEGLTRYQIKTGGFSLSGDGEIRKILFDDKGALKPRVKTCLDNDGTLVVVLFGWDNPDQTDEKGVLQRFVELLAAVDEKYKTGKIEVWRQNNVIGFFSQYPSLALRMAGRDNAIFQSHNSWSRDAEMRREFKISEAQSKIIQAVKEELRNGGDAAIHIRIFGEAGIGKTRLVLEATRADHLSPIAIYCDASKFYDSSLMNELLRDDNTFEAILVLDECDPELRADIWNKFKLSGRRIRIVTIYNEDDETVGTTTYLNAPPLDSEAIKAILQGYVTLKDYIDRWIDFCGGSPRLAHAIGENLQKNSGDLLKSPDTVNIWDRYFLGADGDSQLQQQRRVVLRHLALFKRVGYGGPVSSEAKAVAQFIQEADNSITYAKFQEIVEWCRKRRILQGEYTLYISPKLFHIWLWTEWWRIHGTSFDLESFSKSLPASLVSGFHEIFRYAHESDAAKAVVKKLLGPEGPFIDDYIKTKSGAHFFLALTEADPESALKCLRRTVGTWSKEQLVASTERRDIVWALERIVEWHDLFLDGARLLLNLAEAENERWGNNATGVFPQLFSPAYGEVAPTELPLIERLVVVKEALASGSRERRLVAIEAINHALEADHFVRSIGTHRRGLGRTPQRWTPKTWGEIFDAYRAAWSLLVESVEELPAVERQKAVEVLLSRSRGLLRIHDISPMVVATLDDLAAKPFVDKADLLKAVVATLHYTAREIPDYSKERLVELRDRLTGSDFASLLTRYVGMNLLTDHFDDDGNYADQAQGHIEELAKQAAANPDLLQPELKWLTTKQAEKGHQFGFELATEDEEFSLLPRLIAAMRETQENRTSFFLGGYFSVVFERNPALWDEMLGALSKDENLRSLVPELTWRSGSLTPSSANRILQLAKEGIITPDEFSVFGLGGVIRTMDEESLKEWAEYLLDTRDKRAAFTLLDLFDSYYVFKADKVLPDKELPVELTYKVLTNPALLDTAKVVHDNMVDYHWMQVALRFIEQHSNKAIPLAVFILEHLGEDGTIFGDFHSDAEKTLSVIARQHPDQMWELATKFLGPPIDVRAWRVKDWLQGNLIFIPREVIWKWIDADVEERAWYAATFIPKALPNKEGGVLARDFLIRYGHREDVRNNLTASFQSGIFWGSAAAHYAHKKHELLSLKKNETEENVRRWLDEYIDDLDGLIQQFKIEEERDDFHTPSV